MAHDNTRSAVIAGAFGALNFVTSATISFGAGMDNFGARKLFLLSTIFVFLPTIIAAAASAHFSPGKALLWVILLLAPIFLGLSLGQVPSTPTAMQYLLVGGLPVVGALGVELWALLRHRKIGQRGAEK